ncbi:hypothetical protein DY000_02030578 [Brassica cretica]|uniref:Uncharacterized protein n=1 Tax=Brassica cretica TaxID=69181 RepID=A0ABQ7DR02_BRACR|nr:hypothetical protein DY000_02030578 [Brassica cretica]
MNPRRWNPEIEWEFQLEMVFVQEGKDGKFGICRRDRGRRSRSDLRWVSGKSSQYGKRIGISIITQLKSQKIEGVVINRNGGQQDRGGEKCEHQRKGKGKMFDEADSKWVRAADREHKSYNNKIHLSGHRGEEESSRHRNFRREQTRTHYQDERARVPAGPRGERAACSEAQTEGKEEGEIKEKEMERSNHKEEKVISNPSGGEQELDLEHMDLGLVEGNNLVSDVGTGLEEHHIGNASIRNKESLETESHVIFDEEIEEDVRMQEVASEDLEEKKHMEDMKGKDRVTGEMEKRQGTRKKVVKPSLGAAASNKLKMAQLVAAKRTVAKPGIRHGDHSKQGEEKGTSVPKHDPAKQAKDP